MLMFMLRRFTLTIVMLMFMLMLMLMSRNVDVRLKLVPKVSSVFKMAAGREKTRPWHTAILNAEKILATRFILSITSTVLNYNLVLAT